MFGSLAVAAGTWKQDRQKEKTKKISILVAGGKKGSERECVLGEGETLIFLTCLLQFVCVESMVTALIDMFPSVFRKKGRRELLILAIAVICYLLGLLLVTEVRKE